MGEQIILGINHSFSDPSAALFCGNTLLGFVEEERFTRNKHAKGAFPIRSIQYLLNSERLNLDGIDIIAIPHDCTKYDKGIIAKHYIEINKIYPTNSADLRYQQKHSDYFISANQKSIVIRQLQNYFGDSTIPEIQFISHHLSHAAPAFFYSEMEESLVLSIDGSGEEITTSWWKGKGTKLEILKEIKVPHSLGWLYSAFTEYLGFEAYDGEYKVMGLAAYGKEDTDLKERIAKIVWYDGEGGFSSNPMLLSRGKRSYSYYYPDKFAEHLGHPPRSKAHPLEKWHYDCAYAVQKHLESVVQQMLTYWVNKTEVKNLCISGGIGLNVKMNGAIYSSGIVDGLFTYPLCSDAGQSIGAALGYLYNKNNLNKAKLNHLYYGPKYDDHAIQAALDNCKLDYIKPDNLELLTAKLISEGKVIGWFQEGMEGGPRALGARSILADPRYIESRNKVNAIIKYRELWRPFCPSMLWEDAEKYLVNGFDAKFMILTFAATEMAQKQVPAIVHVDGTCRPQVVCEASNPRYYKLLMEFKKIAGVGTLMNTSFNVKGEPIVCSPLDAIRTFSSTGMDALVIGSFILQKNKSNDA